MWAFAPVCEGRMRQFQNKRIFPLASAIPDANRAPLPGPSQTGSRASDVQSGRSSGVEHNLAKVGVEGSNPFARSIVAIHKQLHCFAACVMTTSRYAHVSVDLLGLL